MDNTDKMGFIYATSFSLKGAHNSISSGVTTKCYTFVIIQGRNNWKALRRMGVNFGAMRFAYWPPTGIAPYDYFRNAILLAY